MDEPKHHITSPRTSLMETRGLGCNPIDLAIYYHDRNQLSKCFVPMLSRRLQRLQRWREHGNGRGTDKEMGIGVQSTQISIVPIYSVYFAITMRSCAVPR